MQVRIGMLGRVRSVSGALRLADTMLLAGGRRNAWAAVCENRRHAADREPAAAGNVTANITGNVTGKQRRHS